MYISIFIKRRLTESPSQISQSIEPDGAMVLRNIPPIYLETSTGKLRGAAKATFVSVPDKNEVFDAEKVYMNILENF